MTTKSRKQIILAAYVGGVNEQTLWEHPEAGSQIDFETFRHVAQTAERGRFDYFFLAEGLALRERAGKVFEQDVAGRPDTLPVLAALAAVTEHIGLVGTINATFNEPYELARQLLSLDHLSGGRAGWNVVTSWDAFTGQNFRRGGFLTREERYSACGGVRPDRPRALGLVGRGRDRRRQGDGRVLDGCRCRRVLALGSAVRHRGPLHRAAEPAGQPRHRAGGHLVAGARLRGGELGSHLLAVLAAARGAGLLPRHQGACSRATDATPTT